MANKKISALTSATTPLAGTEVLPIVQSSATTQVSVADLTAGRAVSAASLTTTGSVTVGILGNVILNGASNYVNLGANQGGGATLAYVSTGNLVITPRSGYNTSLATGNLVQGTAAKGYDFAANTPLSGKTSTVLNWYEEGTFTPNQGAGLTLVGAFSSTGKYTRIGRQVSVSGTVTGATSVAVTAGGVITTSLPFTIGTAGHGNATNAAITASAAVICNTGTSVTSAAAIGATATITFSATYFV